MPLYELPPLSEQPAPGFWSKNRWWLIPLLVADVLFAGWWFSRDASPANDSGASAAAESANAAATEPDTPPQPRGITLAFPTPRAEPFTSDPETVFMPTGSGRIESAYYGSVRTTKLGNGYVASFHEGIDIAPVERDRRSQPLDQITAAADGRVLYVNRIAGNSNYGKYVVLGHADPIGEIYTLYAHMAEIQPGLSPGNPVRSGDPVGKMGHTSSVGFPLARAHVHFEIGMICNTRFNAWYKQTKQKPDHGNYHGHNLIGINPPDAFAWQEAHGQFSMRDYLASLTPAFTVAVKTRRLPEYFARYPSLWTGAPFSGSGYVLAANEGGVPLSGRNATADELARIDRSGAAVLSVNDTELGRNGLRLVTRRKGSWTVGDNGRRWLEILAYQ